jgi:phage head maturation protease
MSETDQPQIPSDSNRPTAGDVEERTTTSVATDGKRIRGRVPYGVESRNIGFIETIRPGALAETKLDGLYVTIDHQDRGLPLARYPTSLTVEHRVDGLHWSFEPPKSRPDVVEAIERGDIAGSSWRMKVAKDSWNGERRAIERIAELGDITLAGSRTPIYPDATVEYRTTSGEGEAALGSVTAMAPAAEDNDNEPPNVDNNPAETGQEVEMAEMAEKQDEQRDSVVEVKDVGSLRVEERAEQAAVKTLADLYASRGFFEERAASVSWDEYRAFTWAAGTSLVHLNPVRRPTCRARSPR